MNSVTVKRHDDAVPVKTTQQHWRILAAHLGVNSCPFPSLPLPFSSLSTSFFCNTSYLQFR